MQPVSDEQEGVVDTAEPLSESLKRGPAASGLFDEGEEATVRVKKPAIKKGGPVAQNTLSENPKTRPGRASFDGISEHPWSKKAPTNTRSTAAVRPSATGPRDDIEAASETSDPPTRVTVVPKKTKSKSPAEPQPPQDDPQQIEAKARVRTLLTQAKSLVNKGEFRSAYRVSQLAQRIADSEDLYFVSGEEQPADIVRSILMKVRSEEIQQASTQGDVDPPNEVKSRTAAQPVSRQTEAQRRSRPKQSTRPEEWSTDQIQEVQGHPDDESATLELVNNPSQESATKSPSKPQMRIKPGPSSRGARDNPAFPPSKPEWRNSRKQPHDPGRSEEDTTTGIATAKEGRLPAQTVGNHKLAGIETGTTPAAPISDLVPGQFSAKSVTPVGTLTSEEKQPKVPKPLAVAENWRNQNLNDVATDRPPLLVAPLPPPEPVIQDSPSTDVADTFATDIQEPSPSQPESKLWMILAAAAGACAMLFVRRRPAAVVRSAGDGK